MKHLLLIGNIDGHSVPLIRYAGKLCVNMNLKLHILQIEKNNDPVLLSSPYYYNNVGFRIDQNLAGKKKELEDFVNKNTKDLIETEWLSYKLMKGNIESCLDKFINEEKIDLLIVRQAIFSNSGIHRNKIFSKLFMNVSDLPILIIPQNQIFKKLQKMVYFTMFTEEDSANIYWLSQNFPGIEIKMIHFSKKEDDLKHKKWVDYLIQETENINLTYQRLDDNIKDFVKKEINSGEAEYDILAKSTRKRKFWERVTNPSTTLNLISDLEIPALVFKKS